MEQVDGGQDGDGGGEPDSRDGQGAGRAGGGEVDDVAGGGDDRAVGQPRCELAEALGQERGGDPPPQPQAAAEQEQAAILDAAREVFAERGYARATIREITRRAGVTYGLIMRHFGTKERLLVEALPGPRAAALVVPGELATLPERIATAFVAEAESAGDGEHAMVTLIRSAASGEEVAMPLYAAAEREVTATFREVLAPAVDAAFARSDSAFSSPPSSTASPAR